MLENQDILFYIFLFSVELNKMIWLNQNKL